MASSLNANFSPIYSQEMADSDDEYDRKRRDKFRGERAEATYRGAERVARPRDDWAER